MRGRTLLHDWLERADDQRRVKRVVPAIQAVDEEIEVGLRALAKPGRRLGSRAASAARDQVDRCRHVQRDADAKRDLERLHQSGTDETRSAVNAVAFDPVPDDTRLMGSVTRPFSIWNVASTLSTSQVPGRFVTLMWSRLVVVSCA